MNEFNERSCLDDSMAVVPTGSADQDDEQGAQPLAATCDDVVRDLVNEGYRTFEPGPDDAVDGFEIRLDQAPDFFEGHCHWEQSVAGGIHDEPHILADAGAGENGERGTSPEGGIRAKCWCKLEKQPFDPQGVRQ
jgi:hypothetical protein